jgi:calcium/calmodulin-dependent protein kinase I
MAMIADFGLARKLVKGETLNGICGTPKFMAPEILNKTGYGKPVDIWAMGMVTYFLLTGQTLFEDQNDMKGADKKTIISWVLKFAPKHWTNVSPSAQDFIWHCLIVDPNARFKVKDCLEHEVKFAENH